MSQAFNWKCTYPRQVYEVIKPFPLAKGGEIAKGTIVEFVTEINSVIENEYFKRVDNKHGTSNGKYWNEYPPVKFRHVLKEERKRRMHHLSHS